MKLSKPYHQSRKRCNQIGRALLKGPYYVIPPVKVDRFGWLDPVLKIVQHQFGVERKDVACSVFVDNTANREKNYLKPLVRYVEWDRVYENKIKRIRSWPKAEITHHVLQEDEQKELDSLLRKLDESLSKVEFLTAGLIIDRSDPSGCYPETEPETLPRSLKIERWNFCQHMELFLGGYTGLNEKIEESARFIMSYIKQVCKDDNELNYRECYEHNLKEVDRSRDTWSYRPPVSK